MVPQTPEETPRVEAEAAAAAPVAEPSLSAKEAEDSERYQGPSKQYIASSYEVIGIVTYLIDSAKKPQETASSNTGSELLRHLPVFFELLFQRFVDNFLKLITDTLTLIFTERPEMLASEDKISYREVLEYDSKAELLSALVDRKVTALSFKGLKELSEDLDRKYGFVLFEKPADLERAAILVEKRNLITHNQARVNRRYLERVPTASEKVGDRLSFEPNYVFAEVTFLNSCAADLSRRALEKFIEALLK